MYIRRPGSRANSQEGYVLLAVLLAMTLLIIGLAVAVPDIAHNLQREREEEMIHRGAQYSRAIRHYYKKFGSYPATMDQLVETNHVRFLRSKYKDPITGQDFKLLHYGDVTMQTGSTGTAAAPGSPLGAQPGQPTATGGQTATGSIFSQGASSQNASPFAGSDSSQQSTNVASAATQAQPQTGNSLAQAGDAPQVGGSSPQSGGTSSTGDTSQQSGNQQGGNQQASGGDSSGDNTQPHPLATSTASGTGSSFGGGAIVGVTSASTKTSIRVFNKKKHYNEWQFFYDPTADRGALIQGPYNGPPTWQPVSVGTSQSTNQQSGTSPFGSSPFGNQTQMPGAQSPATTMPQSSTLASPATTSQP